MLITLWRNRKAQNPLLGAPFRPQAPLPNLPRFSFRVRACTRRTRSSEHRLGDDSTLGLEKVHKCASSPDITHSSAGNTFEMGLHTCRRELVPRIKWNYTKEDYLGAGTCKFQNYRNTREKKKEKKWYLSLAKVKAKRKVCLFNQLHTYYPRCVFLFVRLKRNVSKQRQMSSLHYSPNARTRFSRVCVVGNVCAVTYIQAR